MTRDGFLEHGSKRLGLGSESREVLSTGFRGRMCHEANKLPSPGVDDPLPVHGNTGDDQGS